ncbi:MAG TPA: sensor histidine kinase [Leptospiraceae bacterium]|nr:sensor histidine kinase [Leptospiraceae bacterium]HMW06748.1 sensor histidine kinase [Leptospiraceae bacterium]HMX33701.1 sensor histidine kinase [Leptospiraceae bacterium]HMY32054.1 sensor histidine kinase [Leptospiraceae bacterium]HMZ63977.1 sensor histidine kinase [Leptospiraceae bacterium]
MKIVQVLILLLFSYSSQYAFDRVDLPTKGSSHLTEKIHYFESDSEDLIPEIIKESKSFPWQKSNLSILNFGFTKKNIYIALNVRILGNENQYLVINTPRIDRILFYSPAKGVYRESRAGILDPLSVREFSHRNPIFLLEKTQEEETIVFFHIKSETSLQFELISYDHKSLLETTASEQIYFGIFIGVAILSVLYGLMLFHLMKDFANLYFSIYSLFSLITILIYTEFGFPYLWANYPSFNHFNLFSILLSAIFGVLFYRNVLNIDKNSPVLNRIFNFKLIVLLITFPLLFFIKFSLSLKIVLFEIVLVMPIILVSGFKISLLRYKPGVYVFLSSTLWYIEFLVRVLEYNQFLAFDFSFLDTLLFRILERVILCIALMERVRAIKNEKEQIQKSKLEYEISVQKELSLLNQNMESLVKERTLELEKEKEAALHANLLMNSFVTTVSHDLKSPILNIRNLLDIMIVKEEMDWEERIYYLKNCRNALTSSYQLVNNLLNVERFESGNLEITYQYLDINTILKETIQELAFILNAKNIKIEFQEKEDMIIIGDRQLVLQLFLNILSNAIKFSHENGKIQILSQFNQNYYEIIISDEGIGMSQADVSRLQGNSIYSEKGTKGEVGSGFGFGIIKKIVSLHDGKIQLKSKKNIGTEIQISLPCQDKVAICIWDLPLDYSILREKAECNSIRLLRIFDLNKVTKLLETISPDFFVIGLSFRGFESISKELLNLLKFLENKSMQVYLVSSRDVFEKIKEQKNLLFVISENKNLENIFV